MTERKKDEDLESLFKVFDEKFDEVEKKFTQLEKNLNAARQEKKEEAD